MISLTVNTRGDLLGAIVLNLPTQPLMRPRLNYHSKTIYQDLKNQAELRDALEKHRSDIPTVDQDCIVDCYINYEKGNSRTYNPTSGKFGDIDNLVKAIYDGMQEVGIISNDKKIVGGEYDKCFGELDLVLIKIYSIGEQETYVMGE